MDEKLTQFLIRAKKATYAGKGSETASSRTASHDLVYEEDNLKYYDSYFGGDKFVGEEVMWINNIPYWSMNYAGHVTGENFSGDFLKRALLEVPQDKPFRGPLNYSEGDYVYTCIVDGDFEWFQGYETITYKNKEIYELFFHGSIIN